MIVTSLELALDNAKTEKEILGFIRKIVSESGAKGTVVGLSGGIDSSVVGALCVKALGKERVIGVLMPASHTPKQDTEDARALAKSLGIKTYKVSIGSVFSAIVNSIPIKEPRKIAQANAKARARMLILYYFANNYGMLVAGTGDRSEDLIGFFTKFGDGGVDFLPISHLYKTQVRALGAHLGLPHEVVTKPSSPQLWPGHKAVDELPIDYDKLDVVLYCLFDAKMSKEQTAKAARVDVEIVTEIIERFNTSEHKRASPPMVRPW